MNLDRKVRVGLYVEGAASEELPLIGAPSDVRVITSEENANVEGVRIRTFYCDVYEQRRAMQLGGHNVQGRKKEDLPYLCGEDVSFDGLSELARTQPDQYARLYDEAKKLLEVEELPLENMAEVVMPFATFFVPGASAVTMSMLDDQTVAEYITFHYRQCWDDLISPIIGQSGLPLPGRNIDPRLLINHDCWNTEDETSIKGWAFERLMQNIPARPKVLYAPMAFVRRNISLAEKFLLIKCNRFETWHSARLGRVLNFGLQWDFQTVPRNVGRDQGYYGRPNRYQHPRQRTYRRWDSHPRR